MMILWHLSLVQYEVIDHFLYLSLSVTPLRRCLVTCNAARCVSQYDMFDDIMIHASGAVKWA